jgi:hypothetical protein
LADKQDGHDESRRSLQSIFASRQPFDIVFAFVALWCYGEGFESISDSVFLRAGATSYLTCPVVLFQVCSQQCAIQGVASIRREKNETRNTT